MAECIPHNTDPRNGSIGDSQEIFVDSSVRFLIKVLCTDVENKCMDTKGGKWQRGVGWWWWWDELGDWD